MKPNRNVLPGQPGPRLQQHWDWRAAANFICGGSGSGLVFFAALAGLAGVDVRAQMAAGLALAAAGLLCVWLEIGRPWRALNVFRHLRTSWMTREAAVALLLFGSGTLAVASSHPAAQALAGLCGLAFVYSQARILTADKGIPAWRHARCAPLMLLTGVAEGAGLIAATLPGELHAVAGMVIALAVLARLLLWRRYLDGLRELRRPGGQPARAGSDRAPLRCVRQHRPGQPRTACHGWRARRDRRYGDRARGGGRARHRRGRVMQIHADPARRLHPGHRPRTPPGARRQAPRTACGPGPE